MNPLQKRLKDVMRYYPETGMFVWLPRNGNTKGDKVFNAHFANKIAGSEDIKGYLRTWVFGKHQQVHRLAFLYMEGEFPSDQVDHINGNRKDNRWINLRKVDGFENQKNKKVHRNNNSGVIGVHWCKTYKKWASSITVNGKRFSLGRYENLEDAITIRKFFERLCCFHENHGRRELEENAGS